MDRYTNKIFILIIIIPLSSCAYFYRGHVKLEEISFHKVTDEVLILEIYTSNDLFVESKGKSPYLAYQLNPTSFEKRPDLIKEPYFLVKPLGWEGTSLKYTGKVNEFYKYKTKIPLKVDKSYLSKSGSELYSYADNVEQNDPRFREHALYDFTNGKENFIIFWIGANRGTLGGVYLTSNILMEKYNN